MDTECTVTCTWDPPNDTPLCVTEYFICNELDNVQLSTVQGHITSATFPVNKFTNYLLVVVAKNYDFSPSSSNEYRLNTKSKYILINLRYYYIVLGPGEYDFNLDPVNVPLDDVNTTVLISWEVHNLCIFSYHNNYYFTLVYSQ